MGGPVYRFDAGSPTSTTKFPEYYDGKNFAYECGPRLDQDDRGRRATASTPAPSSRSSSRSSCTQPMDIEFGPDGSLYVLDYGTGYFGGDENSRALPHRLHPGQPHRREALRPT